MTPKRALLPYLLCLSLALAACSGAGAPGDRPAAEVGFITLEASDVPVPAELSGRVVAFETSEIRPQITGYIRRRLFTEGSVVRAGQPLYQVDASLYRAEVNQAQANLESARASAEAAVALADRYRPLAEMEAVSQQEYTDAEAQARVARAAVEQSEAALETARINLRYTTISAPIGGRIGRSQATVGALVSANQADPLSVIQRIDPVYVDIQQSVSDMTALRQALAAGTLQEGSTSVRLEMEDGSLYPLTGTVQFSEMVVNPDTGSITLRARFPNPDDLLLPGMFVRARFEQAVETGALLIPQQALLRDFDGSAYVYVVAEDNTAERRKIVAERTSGANWVVTDGLAAGERVIVQGLADLGHGDPIRPVAATAAERIGVPPSATPPEG
jgi:membrane fusion protein (multidrug efflux system)